MRGANPPVAPPAHLPLRAAADPRRSPPGAFGRPIAGMARRQTPVADPPRARSTASACPIRPILHRATATGGSPMATPPPTSAPSRSVCSRRRSRERRTPAAPAPPPHAPHPRVSRASSTPSCRWPALLGRPVRNQTGQEIGRLDDVVARWADGQMYPPVSGLVIRVGPPPRLRARRRPSTGSATPRCCCARPGSTCATSIRRPGEVLLAKDVLDHQLVDVDGVQVIRAADLYLAEVLGRIRLVGADVSTSTLLRRLGPRRWRPRPTPDRVIDWAAIQPFGEPAGPGGRGDPGAPQDDERRPAPAAARRAGRPARGPAP